MPDHNFPAKQANDKQRKTTTNITNRWKMYSLTSRASPPLRYTHFAADTTHWSSLVRYPIYCHVSCRLPLVKSCRHHARSELMIINIFNPRHGCIVDVRLVVGIDVIDSYLHWNGFVWIEHVGSETNHFTVRVSQRRNMRHMTAATLKWES